MAFAMTRALAEVDGRLGSPDRIDVVDVGAGDGSLLEAMTVVLEGTDLGKRTIFTGIDVRSRPSGLSPHIRWQSSAETDVCGLVMAHEWLDEIPLDIAQRDDAGIDRLVLVDRDGCESLGDPVEGTPAAEWMRMWWPLAAPGERAEVGITRDAAWADLCSCVTAGTVLATDYGHMLGERRPTLRGYRRGSLVDPVPDGSCNLTAHVAIDACAAATPADAALSVSTQRQALGSSADIPDPRGMSTQDYARALEDAFAARTLRDPAGRGSFTWLRADR